MTELAHSADSPGPAVNTWFLKETTLEELLVGVRPIETVDDLALDGLTPEQATSFLRSLR